LVIHCHETPELVTIKRRSSSHAPSLYAEKNIAGIVSGFVTQTSATDSGRLQRRTIAAVPATSIWPGIGSHATNSPMNAAPEIERRVMCQMSGLCRSVPNGRSARCSRISAGVGRYRLSKRRGIKVRRTPVVVGRA
jgi:hypothetical protein